MPRNSGPCWKGWPTPAMQWWEGFWRTPFEAYRRSPQPWWERAGDAHTGGEGDSVDSQRRPAIPCRLVPGGTCRRFRSRLRAIQHQLRLGTVTPQPSTARKTVRALPPMMSLGQSHRLYLLRKQLQGLRRTAHRRMQSHGSSQLQSGSLPKLLGAGAKLRAHRNGLHRRLRRGPLLHRWLPPLPGALNLLLTAISRKRHQRRLLRKCLRRGS